MHKLIRTTEKILHIKINFNLPLKKIDKTNQPYIMTQEELLPMILKKDDKAFTLMYDMYSKSLFGVVYNLINNREEAEDVLHEVFVKIWANIASYNESKGRFFTWIINIARNTTIDKLRSKGFNNSQKNLSSDNFVQLLDDSNKLSHMIDSIGIQEFVKKLKPKCIQIINLLFFKGYTQQEASDELEIPLGTVKTQNRNCINDLRNFLRV
jgi:RNA polymerase sigma-70 factor (ECF subfamily)